LPSSFSSRGSAGEATDEILSVHRRQGVTQNVAAYCLVVAKFKSIRVTANIELLNREAFKIMRNRKKAKAA